MFTFFHRRSEVTVDAFVNSRFIYECAPIVKSMRLAPAWFKKLPNRGVGDAFNNPITGNNNLKNCFGFIELFKRAFTIPNWGETHFHVEGEDIKWWATYKQPVIHSRSQYQGGFPNHTLLKIESPWLIREKSGVQFVAFGAEWNLDTYPIRVLPGMLEFSLMYVSNMFLAFEHRKEPYDVFLPINQPLMHVVPLTDKKVTVKSHLIDNAEYVKLRHDRYHFNPLSQLLRIRKSVEEANDSGD